MSAYGDIDGALARAPAPAEGCERIVLIGESTFRALCSCSYMEGVPTDCASRIRDARIVVTAEFEGWELYDQDTPNRRLRPVVVPAAA